MSIVRDLTMGRAAFCMLLAVEVPLSFRHGAAMFTDLSLHEHCGKFMPEKIFFQAIWQIPVHRNERTMTHFVAVYVIIIIFVSSRI
jgi:hypothetical protein